MSNGLYFRVRPQEGSTPTAGIAPLPGRSSRRDPVQDVLSGKGGADPHCPKSLSLVLGLLSPDLSGEPVSSPHRKEALGT